MFATEQANKAKASSSQLQKKADKSLLPVNKHSSDNSSGLILTGSRPNNYTIQTKLSVGEPNDPYEQEADRTADKVMTMPVSSSGIFNGVQRKCSGCENDEQMQAKPLAGLITPLIQRKSDEDEDVQSKLNLQAKCNECEDDEKVQKKSISEGVTPLIQREAAEEERVQSKSLLQFKENEEEQVQSKSLLQLKENEEEQVQSKSLLQFKENEEEQVQSKRFVQLKTNNESSGVSLSTVENSLNSSKGGGAPMSQNTQSQMESGFGADFSGVRIHTNNSAEEMSQNLNAQAFTHGNDIYFNSGKYNPDTSQGKHLLAHELTHTIQQGSSKVQTSRIQKMSIGSGSPPASWVTRYNASVIPAADRERVNEAIRLIQYIVDHPTEYEDCLRVFSEHCPGNSPTAFIDTFNRVILWKAIRPDALAFANVSLDNIAYTQSGYDEGARELAQTLIHEMGHCCGIDEPHYTADVSAQYCIGPQNEFGARVGIGLNTSIVSLAFTYRRFFDLALGGQLQLTLGGDLDITGLTSGIQDATSSIIQSGEFEFGSLSAGLRGRFNPWGGEGLGGITLGAEAGIDAGNFRVVRETRPDEYEYGAGFVVQSTLGAEFYIPVNPSIIPLSLNTGYRFIRPLNPQAENIHEIIFNLDLLFKLNEGEQNEPLEIEADQMADKVTTMPEQSIMNKIQKADDKAIKIKYGGIVLSERAKIDVLQNRSLFDYEDQRHIRVSDDYKLGYDENYANPFDQFRWKLLKEMIDNGISVNVKAVQLNDEFNVKNIIRIGSTKKETITALTLQALTASGLAAPTQSIDLAIYPTRFKIMASTDDNISQVYYETGPGGRGTLGSSSLAHELLGHMYLAMKGLPHGHGESLEGAEGLTDPFGRPFHGTVDDFIREFVGSEDKIWESPTFHVSPKELNASIGWIEQEGALHITEEGSGNFDQPLYQNWAILSANYEALLANNSEPPVVDHPTAEQVKTRAIAWASALTPGVKAACKNVLYRIKYSNPDKIRTELSSEVYKTIEVQNESYENEKSKTQIQPKQIPGDTANIIQREVRAEKNNAKNLSAIKTTDEPKNKDVTVSFNTKSFAREEGKNHLTSSTENAPVTQVPETSSKQATENKVNEKTSPAEENINSLKQNESKVELKEGAAAATTPVASTEETPAEEIPTGEMPVEETVASGSKESGLGKESAEKKKEGAEETPKVIESPKKPEDDPAFMQVLSENKKTGAKQKSHGDAKVIAKGSQLAAEPPANDVESKAMASQVDKMGAAKENTKKFDAAAFKEKLKAKIGAAIPESEDKAKEFKENNELENVKGSLQSEVKDEKQNATGPVETTAKEEPATDGIEEKTVEQMNTEIAGEKPAIQDAGNAVPKARTEGELSMEEDANSLDVEMEKNEVSEEQLANSNEPEFQGALDSKRESQQQARNAPNEYRETEGPVLEGAENKAQASVGGKLEEMFASREGTLGQVDSSKTTTKSKDEQKRKEVADGLNEIYISTKTKVETILTDLETKVMDDFDSASKAANKVFEDNVSSRLDDYYGFFTIDDTISEWVSGLPPEINEIFLDEKQKFIVSMEVVIDSVALEVETKLNEASAEIETGRIKVKEYIDNLDPSLKQYGEEASTEILGKFDELEQQVADKEDQIADGLSQKYVENVGKLQETFDKIKSEKKGWLSGAFDALAGVIKTIIELKNMLLNTLSKIVHVVGSIISDPIGFLGNLIEALMMGLNNFKDNIVTHLKKGFFTWLMGNMPPGIQFPDVWDLKGIFSFIMQILGLTWSNIRQRAVKKLGEPVVKVLEGVFEIFQVIQKDGLAGLWEYIKEKIGDLKVMVIDAIQDFLIESVVKAGIMWVVGLLNPAGAFIKACKLIYDIVMFFIEKGKMILEFVNAVIDSIAFIVEGNLSKAAKWVEDALAKLIPIAIGFLASLLGLSGISEKVQVIIKKIQAPINKAIDWIIDKAIALAKKLGIDKMVKKVKGSIDKGKEWAKEKIEKGKAALLDWWNTKKTFTVGNEKHSIFFENDSLMVESKKKTFAEFQTDVQTLQNDPALADDKRGELASLYGKAVVLHESLIDAKKAAQKERRESSTTDETSKAEEDFENLKITIKELMKIVQSKSDVPETIIEHPEKANDDKQGVSAVAEPLTIKGDGGSAASADTPLWDIVKKRKVGKGTYYEKGHLISNHFHGSGSDKNNIAIMYRGTNQEFQSTFENHVKNVVWNRDNTNPDGKIASFVVKAHYDGSKSSQLQKLINEIDKTPSSKEIDEKYPNVAMKEEAKKILNGEQKLPTRFTAEASYLEEESGGTFKPGPVIPLGSTSINSIIPDTLPDIEGSAVNKPSLSTSSVADLKKAGISIQFARAIKSYVENQPSGFTFSSAEDFQTKMGSFYKQNPAERTYDIRTQATYVSHLNSVTAELLKGDSAKFTL